MPKDDKKKSKKRKKADKARKRRKAQQTRLGTLRSTLAKPAVAVVGAGATVVSGITRRLRARR